MGKLYKLRKAIEKDPEKWTSAFGGARSAEYATRKPYWAKRSAPWSPGWVPKIWYDGIHSYKTFVRSVLNDLKKK